MARRSKTKGTKFERDVCSDLSLWWTNGMRDDVFWRSATSGARATSRAKKGKDTYGNYGDVSATDPIGDPLIDLFAIEIKRGYNNDSPFDLADVPSKAKPCRWAEWIEQAYRSHDQAGSFSWWIISKRDRRNTTLMIPQFALDAILWHTGFTVLLDIRAEIRFSGGDLYMDVLNVVIFEEFLDNVDPNIVRTVAKKC